MIPNKKTSSRIDPEQRELIERAQARAKQKKRLYLHFILFLIGSFILILLNVVFDYGSTFRPFGVDWFVSAIVLWGIILILHVFNVFVTNKFFGKDWENRQVDRLVEKQLKRIEKLEAKVQKEYPLPKDNEPLPPPVDPNTPDKPLNT